MPSYFFDSSALAKRYHSKVGTETVDEIIQAADSTIRISRLTMVEMASVFAIKVRTQFITRDDADALLRQLREDLISHRYEVVPAGEPEFKTAERMIEQYAFRYRLRSLDALQLAVALSLNRQSMVDHFVASDKILCEIATLEGFSVINPEQP